jgi:hypothetical protein
VREQGIDCRVEVRDRLAILIPENRGTGRLTAEQRHQLLQFAKSEGFTHVAVELDPIVATLPRD